MLFVWSSSLQGLLGGALIGAGASLFLLVNGRVAGISGLLSGLRAAEGWRDPSRLLFLAGLLAAGAAATWLGPTRIGDASVSLQGLIVAGLLVGLGTRLGNGCTSGHGVCGISRGSWPSLAATMVFVATGMMTATLLAQVRGTP